MCWAETMGYWITRRWRFARVSAWRLPRHSLLFACYQADPSGYRGVIAGRMLCALWKVAHLFFPLALKCPQHAVDLALLLVRYM